MYDHVIIGAGSAGCVLAGRLSEDRDVRVLLLEAGPPDKRMEIRVPAAFGKLFKSEVDWNYETEPERFLEGRRLYWPRGKVLGGTSSMNAMMYVRGHRADYDEWSALGNPGWGWSDVLPYFRRAERCGRGPAEHRGTAGPLSVQDLRDPNPATRAFVAAAQEAGIPRSHDINAPPHEGVDFSQVTQRRGARCSAADAYLKPARSRRNLEVVTGAHATKILLDGRRAIGVEYRVGEEVRTARASREVLVSCGAINSPQLLMLSGIGPAGRLREVGIDPVHDLPGVGENLQDHLIIGVIRRCTRPITLVGAESRKELLKYLLLRKGMLTSCVAEALAFVRSGPEVDAPDLELIFAPVPYIDHGLVAPPGHGLTIGVVLLRPASRGRITLRSRDAFAPPAIAPHYLSDPDGEDLRCLRAGVEQAQRIFSMPALAPLVGEPIEPAADVRGEAELESYIREQAETVYHPVGTCRMGTDGEAVVDPALRVRGIEGLRVVDASIMPVHVRGHPNAVAIMIAEKAADLIRERGPARDAAPRPAEADAPARTIQRA